MEKWKIIIVILIVIVIVASIILFLERPWEDNNQDEQQIPPNSGTFPQPEIVAELSDTSIKERIEDIPVWRAQIQLKTASIDDANTDDAIQIALRKQDMSSITVRNMPMMMRDIEVHDIKPTFPDSPKNDFEKGDNKIYDLLVKDIKTINDINQLTIQKFYSDGWCLKSYALHINEIKVFSEEFNNCQWFDNEPFEHRKYILEGWELRTFSNDWKKSYDNQKFPVTYETVDLEKKIEALIGHINNYDTHYSWEGNVDVRWIEDNTFSIEFDLKKERNLDFDIDGTVFLAGDVDCRSGTVFMNVVSSDMSTAQDAVNEAMEAISRTSGGAGAFFISPMWLDDIGKEHLQNVILYRSQDNVCPDILSNSNGVLIR